MQVLRSPDAPRNEKRTALRFIAHLVGDIHQPLHAGFAEDRGGNSVDGGFNGRKENLHSLWDTTLVELEQGTPLEVAGRIQAEVTGEDRQNGSKGLRQIGPYSRWLLLGPQLLPPTCEGRDRCNLHRTGTRCHSESIGASGNAIDAVAE